MLPANVLFFGTKPDIFNAIKNCVLPIKYYILIIKAYLIFIRQYFHIH